MPLLKSSRAWYRDIAKGFIRQRVLKTVFSRHHSPRFIAGLCGVQIDKSRGRVGICAAGDYGCSVGADIPADINCRAVILGFRIICHCFRGCAGWQIDDGQRQQKSHDACGFHTVYASFVYWLVQWCVTQPDRSVPVADSALPLVAYTAEPATYWSCPY